MSPTALVVIDMLNTYDHDDAELLVESVREIVPTLRELIARAELQEVRVIYVNDNYGDWRLGREQLAERAMRGADPSLVEPVLPSERAAFVMKARHSIFYETPLDYLLRSEGIERVVLTGQVTEQCVLYSALDGYVRHYPIVVPRDAVAHIHEDLGDAAMRMMERNMSARLCTAADLFDDDDDG